VFRVRFQSHVLKEVPHGTAQFVKSVESRGDVQISPARQPERKRRFQIVKLEERIAPGGGGAPDSVTPHTHQTIHAAHCRFP
jgi:hypothetical protein